MSNESFELARDSERRPKRLHVMPTVNTNQSRLFDFGLNDLPGQSLLFNSDAGDIHNPTTMENKINARPT